MLSGRPLFPGRDYHNQLQLILDVLGTPTVRFRLCSVDSCLIVGAA